MHVGLSSRLRAAHAVRGFLDLPPHRPAITAARIRAGMPSRYKRLDRTALVEDYAGGMTAPEVAEKHGTVQSTVWTYASKDGRAVKQRPPKRRKRT